ncbi:hypothetical protein M441DRAFT_43096 [Trichoderma asperellum CBS 433.97]|uniref:Uncharacterized protein n=1 Tax=Trichoderma asperellum (strain ATCC 204424 / CBS 433.97 / NBRC 101777) TaxID=1042311 RepID=A0A2T3ZJM8_TRIA4|nr:hypothetical protein M441DRAFT_43096 [Trichoderma asperellum CBS 433.97]PTB44973.1 hypothetical protein M441DRAFT_43096 [Trichoderma asperellum CBS 433.97]
MAKFRVSSQLEVRTVGAVYRTLLLETTGNKNNSQNLKSRASPAPQAKEERQCPMPWPKLLDSEPQGHRAPGRPPGHTKAAAAAPFSQAEKPRLWMPERGQSGAVGGGRWAYKQQRLPCMVSGGRAMQSPS